jgi:hypothetical protein
MDRRVGPDWRQSDVFHLANTALCESEDQARRRARRRRAILASGARLAALAFFTFGPGLAVADRSESPPGALHRGSAPVARSAAVERAAEGERDGAASAPRDHAGAPVSAPPPRRDPATAAGAKINDLPVAPLE